MCGKFELKLNENKNEISCNSWHRTPKEVAHPTLLFHLSPLSPQIFSAPEYLNNVHIGSGQNTSHRVFLLHRCLKQTPRKSKNRASQDLLHPNTLSASCYFQFREFPEFDVVCVLVTIKGCLFQVFVQSPLELLICFQPCSDSPYSECIQRISSNCGPAETGGEVGVEKSGGVKFLKLIPFMFLLLCWPS